ncbi:hypothetical protein ACXYTJ_00390 [Gilvimarinus sp. F26214L]|uniref:hypothetical protein n=1 Tax=Gilvimarinus sp. DZF01 TaxID=3461371 RepID=UPI004045A4EE
MTTNESLPHPEEGAFAIQASLHPENSENILLRGRLSVRRGQNGVPDAASDVLKHIVLVVTRTTNYQSVTPFKETVVFEDDVQSHGDICSASFNINVMDHIEFGGEGDYYILCSVGTYLSNVARVSIASPSAQQHGVKPVGWVSKA